jgi:hypothetical protein
MTDELSNIVEQATNDDEITKGSMVEALTDLIRELKGNDIGFMFDVDEDDHFSSFETTDFSELEY